MTEGDKDSSGELSSFLHLTGWRPLVLALIAGIAGAIGLFGALNAPAEFQARYVLNAQRVADDDFTPAELDIFVEEIAQTAQFPAVAIAVEERTGFVIEDDYDITVNQSGSNLAIVDINVVSSSESGAKQVAVETGIEALSITLDKILGGHEASARQIDESIVESEAKISQLTEDADGLNPTTAYAIAVQAVIDRRNFLENRPTETVTLSDGSTVERDVPEPAPPLADLLARASELEPIDRAYQREFSTLDQLNIRLGDRNNDVRDAKAALGLVEVERDDARIISEVVTEETSRIAGLLSGLLLFAVPAALLVILGFVIFDLLRKKTPADPLRRSDDFSPAGVLEAQAQRALPEATKVTPLVVVDEEDRELDASVLDVEDEPELDEEPELDGDEPKGSKRSKDGRWGRDASSKAG